MVRDNAQLAEVRADAMNCGKVPLLKKTVDFLKITAMDLSFSEKIEMTAQEKMQALISHFGSVEAYQAEIFDDIPPLFLMVCDENGDVVVDRESVGAYIEKEMAEHHLSFEKLMERDVGRFDRIVSDLYDRVLM